MPLALGHSNWTLCAPSSSNGVTPVNHSQAWAYGRPAQKELLGNKFSGTSDPVNTVSEFMMACFFFFFFPSRKVFLGVKPSLRRVKKNQRKRQHKKSRILLRLKLIPNVIFWPRETLICVGWAESCHSLSNTPSESICLLSVHSPRWFWEDHLSKPGFSLGPIYFPLLFPFPLSRVYSLVIKPILGVLRKELPDDDNSHSCWFLKFLASGCPPCHTIFFF